MQNTYVILLLLFLYINVISAFFKKHDTMTDIAKEAKNTEQDAEAKMKTEKDQLKANLALKHLTRPR
jgi:Na+-transporting methylmalonyl-CoA/oxaloacetate decarboxylase gamma subunit